MTATATQKKLLPPAFTPTVLEDMRQKWTPLDMAVALDMRVKAIEKADDTTFIELGILICEIEDQGLWKLLPGEYKSFGEWMGSGPHNGQSRAKRYAARAAALELKDIAVRDLQEMPRCNVDVMKKLPRKKRSHPDIVKAAKELPEHEFRRKVQAEIPESHIEDTTPMRFKPEASQRRVIDATLETAMFRYQVHTREEALEAICVEVQKVWEYEDKMQAKAGEA